jgi:hypothetical protein
MAAAVLVFPVWRVRRRAGAAVFAALGELEALERAEQRLVGLCALFGVALVAVLQVLTRL